MLVRLGTRIQETANTTYLETICMLDSSSIQANYMTMEWEVFFRCHLSTEFFRRYSVLTFFFTIHAFI